ncbi:MAG: hypothetical protein HYZ89_02945 [Candidatus Omnitrophica bacterium]|nr:hypothetical protein [Candidatus Omnitrophota bacterium]
MKRFRAGQAPVPTFGVYRARVRGSLSRREIYDERLGRDILKSERQIKRGEVVPWSEAKRRHGL